MVLLSFLSVGTSPTSASGSGQLLLPVHLPLPNSSHPTVDSSYVVPASGGASGTSTININVTRTESGVFYVELTGLSLTRMQGKQIEIRSAKGREISDANENKGRGLLTLHTTVDSSHCTVLLYLSIFFQYFRHQLCRANLSLLRACDCGSFTTHRRRSLLCPVVKQL
jgi:hypothetical protein